jgi:hypothetical protein
LLVTGLPVAAGRLTAADQLLLLAGPEQQTYPIWWEPRAFWPDGSVRWLFLHAFLPPTAHTFSLSLAAGEQARPDPGAWAEDWPCRPIRVQSGDSELTVSWGATEQVCLRQTINCSPAVPVSPWSVCLLEDSPLAPLYQIESEPGQVLRTTLLLRIDRCHGTIYVTLRHSVCTDADVRLEQIRYMVQATTDGRTSDTAITRTDLSRHDPDDLAVATDRLTAVLIRGKRRGPVALSVHDPQTPVITLTLAGPGQELQLGSGISLRQELRLCFGQDRLPAQMILPVGYVAASRVFGDLPVIRPDDPSPVAPGLAIGLGCLLQQGLQQVESWPQPEPGVLHDGDWLLDPGQYGAVGYRAFADNEYDTPYAYYLAHAALNRPDYLAVALRGGAHMADIDCRCTDGAMLYHGYGDTAEDHQRHRPEQGDLGHVWTDGLWATYFWSGDRFARDAALKLTEQVMRTFDAGSLADAFALCERNLGWPLLVAVSALETGLPVARAAAFGRRIISFMDDYTRDPDRHYQDPRGPVWWRTAMQDGSKPFMLGVLGEAIDRYGQWCQDARCPQILERISRFILQLFDPVRVDFAYEYNAYGPNHRQIAAQQLIPLFARTLLAGFWRGRLNPACERAMASLHASAWCLFADKNGKDIALLTRGLLPALAMLEQIRLAERQSGDAAVPPSDGKPQAGLSGQTGRAHQGVILPLLPGVYSDAGRLVIEYKPQCLAADTLNRQALVHLCAEPPNRSSVSVITFYDRIQIRFYDPEGSLIDSLDCFPGGEFFSPGSSHRLDIRYRAPGPAVLAIDGKASARISLTRPISGSFRFLYVGCKPGNWSVCGTVSVQADFTQEECVSDDRT